jgi:RNA 3'-terminal phosphate cyclase (ATP)
MSPPIARSHEKDIPRGTVKKRHKSDCTNPVNNKKARESRNSNDVSGSSNCRIMDRRSPNDNIIVNVENSTSHGITDYGKIVTIDGSFGEGGGQVLRNACAYAAILRTSIKIVNVRSGRPKPGLQRQHLVGLQLLEECCDGQAKLVGGSLGSEEVQFLVSNHTSSHPADRSGERGENCTNLEDSDGDLTLGRSNANYNTKNRYTGDTKTAGSICLLLQAVLPLGLFSPPRVGGNINTDDDELFFILKGGTNATMAPQLDYFESIFLPTLKRCCRLDDEIINTRVLRRGFFPRGGGEVHVTVKPGRVQLPLPAIRLTERGTITEINIRAYSGGNCPRSVAKQLADSAKSYLLSSSSSDICWKAIDVTCNILHYDDALGSGSGIIIVAKTSSGCLLGGSAVGTPRVLLPETAQRAAVEILDAIGRDGIGNSCVDEHMQDQLVLYMALAEGVSEIYTACLTLHTQTAIWLAGQMCSARFEVTRLDKGIAKSDDKTTGRIPGLHSIRCNGSSFCRLLGKAHDETEMIGNIIDG